MYCCHEVIYPSSYLKVRHHLWTTHTSFVTQSLHFYVNKAFTIFIGIFQGGQSAALGPLYISFVRNIQDQINAEINKKKF